VIETAPSARATFLGGKMQQSVDSPVEEAVRSELVSGEAKFPVSRENTGNFIDFGLGRPKLSSNGDYNQ